MESINEATQIYVFAKQVLGDRPVFVGPAVAPVPKTFAQLKDDIDAFGNPIVVLENAAPLIDGEVVDDSGIAVVSGLGFASYFCVPFNAKLLSYWDTVADRLFKIRNGMNIEGVVRSLPLFQPAIDPAMLVRAAAAGVDIGSVVGGAAVPGHYRFNVMLARAQALTASVRSLGQALLSALEKRDGEELARLRQTHEGALLAAVTEVRERQVDEAKANVEALKRTKKMVQARQDYYDRLVSVGWIPKETQAAELTEGADAAQLIASQIQLLGSFISIIPNITAGTLSGAEVGGAMIGRMFEMQSSAISIDAAQWRGKAGQLTTAAAFQRRAQEWKQQRAQAALELDQLEKQLVAAELRVEIAKRELQNHGLQVRHSSQVMDWMSSKFTNRELYDWMASQLATLHFQSFQLALTTARQAEACFKRELGLATASYIGSSYWDGNRKGLLAGERLQADLERLDLAYLANDLREHELTKHISLARLDPLALARLREDGECYFEVPEALFDLDCPNHYMRRLQSVALSFAAVTGQYGSVSSKLTLHSATIRAADGVLASDDRSTELPTIVTSSAAQDSGLFQADLKDPRYLPFERRGASGLWHLALTATEIRQLDWGSITDVTLHLRYTARYRDTAATLALADVKLGYQSPSATPIVDDGGPTFLLSAKRDAPDELHAMRSATTSQTSFSLDVTADMLGSLAGRSLRSVVLIPVGVTLPDETPFATLNDVVVAAAVPLGGVRCHVTSLSGAPNKIYTLSTSTAGVDLRTLTDLLLVLVLN